MTAKEAKIAEYAELLEDGYLFLQCQASTPRGKICWHDCEPAKKRVCRQCGCSHTAEETATCEHCGSDEYDDPETILICPECGWWCRLDEGAAVLYELMKNDVDEEG